MVKPHGLRIHCGRLPALMQVGFLCHGLRAGRVWSLSPSVAGSVVWLLTTGASMFNALESVGKGNRHKQIRCLLRWAKQRYCSYFCPWSTDILFDRANDGRADVRGTATHITLAKTIRLTQTCVCRMMIALHDPESGEVKEHTHRPCNIWFEPEIAYASLMFMKKDERRAHKWLWLLVMIYAT